MAWFYVTFVKYTHNWYGRPRYRKPLECGNNLGERKTINLVKAKLGSF